MRNPARQSLSSLEGCGVTLFDYGFPCAEPDSEIADVALCPCDEGGYEQPLEIRVNSGCVLLVEHRCLVDCLVVLCLPPGVVVSPMPVLVSQFPQFEPLL